ncbi:energy-coupling factor ABC transporter ATP-binding protein [Desulfosarcina sp. OttesenSCG-928-B08]|nr:energy-coupling factor ABC transporter ATP-binding protein [Desulfosarcina sp. OttesenSCG-928-B08]
MTPILRVSHLSHRFPDGTLALDQVNLDIAAGELVVLAGANGSGKTTLLRHLNGLLLPQSGDVEVNGVSVKKNPKAAREIVGMVFQDADSQIVGETVYDDAAFGPENLKLDRQTIDERVRKALSVVGLLEMADKPSWGLSGGQKRRLAIAGVLAMNPAVIVMDEPFSNLDYPSLCQVRDQILALHQNGRTLVIATHELEKIIQYAGRLVVMEKGRVVRDGAPQDMAGNLEPYGICSPCFLHTDCRRSPWH